MRKKVYDLFNSEAEAEEAVKQLVEKGYQEDFISIVAKSFDEANSLRESTKAHVHTARNPAENSDEKQPIKEKLKAAAKGEISFYGRDLDNAAIKLGEFGLTKEEEDHYQEAIDEGKVLVLVAEEQSPPR